MSQLLDYLTQIEALHQYRQAPAYAEKIYQIAEFQKQRAAQTYEDLLIQPRYKAATQFLLDDVYGTPDHFERDCQMKRAYQSMIKLLPNEVLQTLTAAICLHALSMQLDHEMTEYCLASNCQAESVETYAAIMQAANARHDRQQQLSLILEVGQDLDELVKNRFVLTALKFAKKPAEIAGVILLHNYLVAGIDAYKSMKGAQQFLRTIETREQQWLAHVYHD